MTEKGIAFIVGIFLIVLLVTRFWFENDLSYRICSWSKRPHWPL